MHSVFSGLPPSQLGRRYPNPHFPWSLGSSPAAAANNRSIQGPSQSHCGFGQARTSPAAKDPEAGVRICFSHLSQSRNILLKIFWGDTCTTMCKFKFLESRLREPIGSRATMLFSMEKSPCWHYFLASKLSPKKLELTPSRCISSANRTNLDCICGVIFVWPHSGFTNSECLVI